ncbi:MAG: hypothetical protein ACJZ2N_03780 [Candidatus Poseidoniales archaeon]
MDSNPTRKLVVSAMTAVLLLSSILFVTEATADPNDLSVSNLYEEAGTPPPRENILYHYTVEWENNGDATESATVRLYPNCDQSGTFDESDSISMGPGESGLVNLSITFTDTGETCYSATIFQGSSHYGEFTNYAMVEPETGVADLFVNLNMTQDSASIAEPVTVSFEYGNDGVVSTLHPVTIKAFFDPVGNDHTNYFDPSPFTFDYLTPPESGMPAEFMDWEFRIPDGTCDLGPEYNSSESCDGSGGIWTATDGRMHKFTVYIDSEENNTDEDDDLQNNIDTWEICVGNCDQPDLQVAEEGTGEDSIMSEPLEAVAGGIISFVYGIANTGPGDADCPPAGPNCPGAVGELVTHLEVQKCAGDAEDPCAGSPWEYKNISKVIRTPIPKCCENNVLYDNDALKLNWSTTPSDAGLYNVRIFVDANNVVEELDENNNYLDWYKVKEEYFELKEQRPDMMVQGIDPGASVIYKDDEQTLQIQVLQSEFGDAMADNVEVFLKIIEPDGVIIDWFPLTTNLTVGLAPDITFFPYTWTPMKTGTYEFMAWVDRGDIDEDSEYNGGDILEWNEDNNKLVNSRFILVEPKLPDLKISSLTVTPLNSDGYGMVGVSSELTATLVNDGVRALDSSEAAKLSIAFYVVSPFTTQLAEIFVSEACSCDPTLNISESIDITIPIKFALNDNYRLAAIVDEGPTPQSQGQIQEVSETNNQNFLNLYAASSVDAHVSNLNVDVGDGLAGKVHPITFDLGMSNLAEGETYRLFFNVSVSGTFGWGEIMALSTQNSTGTYSIGTGYSLAGPIAYVDFNTSYLVSSVSIPWIPSKDRTDVYNVSVTVSSAINVDLTNDTTYVNKISMEKLTTDIVVEAIKVTESGGSATIRVTVLYQRGEDPTLDGIAVAMEVYRASDFEDGEAPLTTLTTKTLSSPLARGDSDSLSFTWAVKNGDFIFVAILDPDDLIKEVDENNRFPSKLVTFGDSGPVVTEDEEDEGLLPAPSLITSIALLGAIAILRRR